MSVFITCLQARTPARRTKSCLNPSGEANHWWPHPVPFLTAEMFPQINLVPEIQPEATIGQLSSYCMHPWRIGCGPPTHAVAWQDTNLQFILWWKSWNEPWAAVMYLFLHAIRSLVQVWSDITLCLIYFQVWANVIKDFCLLSYNVVPETAVSLIFWRSYPTSVFIMILLLLCSEAEAKPHESRHCFLFSHSAFDSARIFPAAMNVWGTRSITMVPLELTVDSSLTFKLILVDSVDSRHIHVSAKILSTFGQFTLSPVLRVSLLGDGMESVPSETVLKLYDRRCMANARADFDEGHPFTLQKEREYRQYWNAWSEVIAQIEFMITSSHVSCSFTFLLLSWLPHTLHHSSLFCVTSTNTPPIYLQLPGASPALDKPVSSKNSLFWLTWTSTLQTTLWPPPCPFKGLFGVYWIPPTFLW